MSQPPNENRDDPQDRVDAFNAYQPVGSRVEYRRHSGAPWIETRVRGEAYVMGGHSAMVFLEGVSGSWSLDHVRPTGDAV